MKLKGYCKIELKDKNTGKVERVEEHNMITELKLINNRLSIKYCWGNEYPS